MSDEQRNILATFAQGGNAQAEHVEAKIKITAECAFGHSLLQIAVGGGQDADVDGNAARAADGTNFFFLNGAQEFGLEVDGKLADFVEKNGSAFGDGEQSFLGLIGAGEGAFDIAEQFALNQRGDERAAVDGNKRLVVERSGVMNGARDHFLAGTAFSEDQHGMGAVGGLGDDAVKLLHLGSAADDAAVPLLGFELLAQHAVFGFQLEVIGDALAATA